MPTRSISLTEHLDGLIEDNVASGRYRDASEVVGEALRLLDERQQAQRRKLAALKAAVDEGIRDAERGNVVEVPADDIEGFLNRIGEEAVARSGTD